MTGKNVDNKYRLLRFIGHQDWLRVGLRHKFIQLFVNPEKCGRQEFVVDYFGYKFKGSLDQYIDWCVYFYGAYEKQEMLLLKNIASKIKDPIFLDIGANVGDYALFMSRYCKEVHAFEPYDKVFRQLREEVEINELKNVTIHSVALGDVEKILTLYVPVDGINDGMSSFIPSHSQGNKAYGQLKVIRGDDYFLRNNIGRADIIKIDVEGFEKQVIEGLSETIGRCRPFILTEVSKTTLGEFKEGNGFESLVYGYKIEEIRSNRKCMLLFNRPSYELRPNGLTGEKVNVLLSPKEKM